MHTSLVHFPHEAWTSLRSIWMGWQFTPSTCATVGQPPWQMLGATRTANSCLQTSHGAVAVRGSVPGPPSQVKSAGFRQRPQTTCSRSVQRSRVSRPSRERPTRRTSTPCLRTSSAVHPVAGAGAAGPAALAGGASAPGASPVALPIARSLQTRKRSAQSRALRPPPTLCAMSCQRRLTSASSLNSTRASSSLDCSSPVQGTAGGCASLSAACALAAAAAAAAAAGRRWWLCPCQPPSPQTSCVQCGPLTVAGRERSGGPPWPSHFPRPAVAPPLAAAPTPAGASAIRRWPEGWQRQGLQHRRPLPAPQRQRRVPQRPVHWLRAARRRRRMPGGKGHWWCRGPRRWPRSLQPRPGGRGPPQWPPRHQPPPPPSLLPAGGRGPRRWLPPSPQRRNPASQLSPPARPKQRRSHPLRRRPLASAAGPLLSAASRSPEGLPPSPLPASARRRQH
mmetsp:Transcript_60664/g.190682  ORF Transcript_60664/g.190682 Transcript_60664/m.190682 type:complete len:450 (+) Transcript_60664:698-2047(+)